MGAVSYEIFNKGLESIRMPSNAYLPPGDADELPAERAEGDLGEERAVQEASEDGGGSPEAKGQAWTAVRAVFSLL